MHIRFGTQDKVRRFGEQMSKCWITITNKTVGDSYGLKSKNKNRLHAVMDAAHIKEALHKAGFDDAQIEIREEI